MNSEMEEEEIFVPLKEKRSMNQRKAALLIFALIILGTGLFFSVLQVVRLGGMPKIIFLVLALALGYITYETINKLRQLLTKNK